MADVDKGFNPGDVVSLKSGSPKMTVIGSSTVAGLPQSGTVDVVWSVFETQRLEFATLPAVTLRKG